MNGYTIFEGNIKKDKGDILTVLERNLENVSLQMYEWKYESCPYGDACCWLAKDEKSGSLVGSAGLFPRKIFIKGEPVIVAIAGDFAVDKKHRAFGPALMLQRDIQSELSNLKFKFIYGIPNELSSLLFLRIGYKKIGTFKRFIKILQTESISKKHLCLFIHFKPLLRAIEILISSRMSLRTIDFLINLFSKEKRYRKSFNYSVEMPEFFDDRFDVFWRKVSKQFTIIGERNSNFLNWRFKQSSSQDYKIFCIVNDKKDIVGYLVYFFRDNICYIVDMLFVTSEDIIDALLAEFVLYVRENKIGAIVIRYLGNKLFEEKLKKFNFFMTKKNNIDVVIYSPNFSFESDLLDKKNWHFFVSDNDV